MSSSLLASGKAVSRVSTPSRRQSQRGLQAPSAAQAGNLSNTGRLKRLLFQGRVTPPRALMCEDTPCVGAWPARSELETSKLPQVSPRNGRLGKCFCRRLVITSPADRSSHLRPSLTAQSRNSAGSTMCISCWRQNGPQSGAMGFESSP